MPEPKITAKDVIKALKQIRGDVEITSIDMDMDWVNGIVSEITLDVYLKKDDWTKRERINLYKPAEKEPEPEKIY